MLIMPCSGPFLHFPKKKPTKFVKNNQRNIPAKFAIQSEK